MALTVREASIDRRRRRKKRSLMDKWCKKCIYQSGQERINECDFYMITGIRRGCAGDQNCKRFTPGKRKKPEVGAIARRADES